MGTKGNEAAAVNQAPHERLLVAGDRVALCSHIETSYEGKAMGSTYETPQEPFIGGPAVVGMFVCLPCSTAIAEARERRRSDPGARARGVALLPKVLDQATATAINRAFMKAGV